MEDDCQCPHNREQFVNIDRCLELISDLRTLPGDDAASQANDNETAIFKQQSESEKLVETFRKLIDPFQEQPELLDPYLADLILKLIEVINDRDNISQLTYHTTFKFLYQLIKVTGFKHVAKKFPHETDKLPLLIQLLDKENPEDRRNWQTRFVLLVWLSIVILTPFDLSKFDFSSTTETSIAQRIQGVLLKSLDLHDSCQHVAAYCLAKFFSRPDILKASSSLSGNLVDQFRDDAYVDKFVADALYELANVKTGITGSMDDIKLIGRLRGLCYMYKFLPRAEMKQRSPMILGVIEKLDMEKINRELVNHLIIKLAQRAGLALLPKPVATWRYKRGSRILGSLADEMNRKADDNGQLSSGNRQEGAPQTNLSDQQHASTTNHCAEEVEEWQSEGSGSSNLADYLESLLSILFVAAQNSQTKIRWSAAKGIARLASRLNRERASDVIDMVLQNFFNDTSSDFAWHGGCLTLAEMSRNGLILEEKLADVIGVVGRAILYDKIKGASAVGTHVRESACYVCWAMARSYEDNLLAPYVSQISTNLLCTMLFDRELQCRRAASATFQELVGRQGAFNEEAIAILTQLDYQNVGQRQFAYLELAMQVASYGPNYSEPFTEHLIGRKICHWDVKLRRLACDSLSALMLHLRQDYVRTKVLPKLIELGEQNQDNNAKHGALLGLAKVIGGLAPLQFEYPEGLIEFVGGIVEACEKQLKNKQQGPNFMEAIGCMITSCELAGFNYAASGKEENNKATSSTSGTLEQWETTALSALNSDDVSLREIGAQALLTLYRTYYKDNKTNQDRILTILNKSLASPNESSRCGALLALSKLSEALSDCTTTGSLAGRAGTDTNQEQQRQFKPRTDADTPDIILMSLASYIGQPTHEKTRGGYIFAQAKATACEAFTRFVSKLEPHRIIVSSRLIAAGYDALLEKTEDYTFDKRGDIGVVVRRAAIRSLQELTLHLLSIGSMTSWFQSRSRLCTLLARILQQAVSYNNTAREQAAHSFYKLIVSDLLPLEETLPTGYKQEILSLFERYEVNDEFNWRDDSTPIFVSLLEKREFSRDLWIGLIPALGQESDMCAKQFRDSLADYLLSFDDNDLDANNKNSSQTSTRLALLEDFLSTLESLQSAGSRLVTAGLIAADYLLGQGLMEAIDTDYQRRLLAFCWQARKSGAGTTAGLDPKRPSAVKRLLNSALQFDTDDMYIIQ